MKAHTQYSVTFIKAELNQTSQKATHLAWPLLLIRFPLSQSNVKEGSSSLPFQEAEAALSPTVPSFCFLSMAAS